MLSFRGQPMDLSDRWKSSLNHPPVPATDEERFASPVRQILPSLMKTSALFASLLSVVACLPAFAQSAATAPAAAAAPVADDSKPASTTLRGEQYPRIDSQLRATFRIASPTAQKIQV